MDAFDLFNKTSTTLESSYKELEKRVAELDVELAEKNNFLASILEGLPVGVVVTESDGIITTVNAAASVILGESEGGEEELIGAKLSEKLRSVRPALDEFKGGIVPEILNESLEVECDISATDGKKKTVTVASIKLRNLSGVETGYLTVIKDVSDLKRLRDSVERDKRFTAMGEMAASIAHQIRNPLGSIELFASVLNDELKEDEPNQRVAAEIMHAVKTLNNTLSNMLLFANTSLPRKTRVTVDELLSDVRDVCSFMLKESGVEFKLTNDAAGTEIDIDLELFKQALSNLVMNAADSASETADGFVELSAISEEGELHILVSDNGKGIDDSKVDRVYDPFFTTKPKGTGLGLAVVNNIVKLHNGFIELISSTGKGTTFDITLPTRFKTED